MEIMPKRDVVACCPQPCSTQPSEPILFPRSRIKYADFPYLYYTSARGSSPWRPDVDMGTDCHENHNASLGFSRADMSVPRTTRGVVFYGNETPIFGQSDSKSGSPPYKEKKTLPGTLADVSEFVCAAALDDVSNSQPNNTSTHAPPISVGRVG
ncbi:unnamed protein product [Rodentolepis nana]|uniref:Uncharacterized protein n=1 Tax=Rodentolepis nana TaxID=102285 RepID=A0A0R3T4G9_RODNA|nr:unnamed protein product [Rodentolepis nana]